MSGVKYVSQRRRLNLASQAGTAAVEFSLIVTIFLTIVFGIIELARVVYIVNTLYMVTQRAAHDAAKTDVKADSATIRQKAIFRTSPGMLAVGKPVTDEHVRIDYMYLKLNGDSSLTPEPIADNQLPANPAKNRMKCLADPNDPQCVRFVRVRICDPAELTKCKAVRYRTIVPLVDLPLDLPYATTIVMAEGLGYTEGMLPGP